MTALKEIHVPDLGTSEAVPVAEVFVSPGQKVKKEEPLLALESDKAVMEIPSPFDCIIRELKAAEGDKLKTGDLIATAEVEDEAVPEAPAPLPPKKEPRDQDKPDGETPSENRKKEKPRPPEPSLRPDEKVPHASPSVRHYARELGADLRQIKGTGPKERIRREDVQNHIKKVLKNPGQSGAAAGLPALPESDPSQFGPVEKMELTSIQKISGPHLHASWVNIPHVTHFDQVDITNLETWRKELNGKGIHGVKFSALAFVVKALYKAVEEFPRFNAVLAGPSGPLLIRKYYNIGIAVDTPRGLLVPVVKDVDKKTLTEIVRDIADLAEKGREGRLSPRDLQGAGISISNLGGIGGTGFTPIINPPEVAILGLSRSRMQPVWQEGEFVPRLMLPLSLSYDHRVIDGALAARFTRYLAELLEDMKKILL